jgi:cell division protein FtsB
MTTARLLSHPIIILALSIGGIIFFISLNKSAEKTQNSSENIRVLEYEVNQISNDVIELEKNIEKTESEQFKEKVVRNELLLKKEGEYVLQIVESDDSNNEFKCENDDCSENNLISKKSNIDEWKKLLFSKN